MPIFDQGYQHFSGTLSGHAWRWLTITRHGVRIGMKNIFLRLLVIVSWLPAVGLAIYAAAAACKHDRLKRSYSGATVGDPVQIFRQAIGDWNENYLGNFVGMERAQFFLKG